MAETEYFNEFLGVANFAQGGKSEDDSEYHLSEFPFVEILWLADAARGQGLGGWLLAQAEQIALERGCRAAHLDTLSFQALPFYQRRGYTVFGVLDDLPPGYRRYFLKKQLQPRIEDRG